VSSYTRPRGGATGLQALCSLRFAQLGEYEGVAPLESDSRPSLICSAPTPAARSASAFNDRLTFPGDTGTHSPNL